MTARQRLVVGVDGSPASAAAVRWAADYAARTGADVDAVYVLEPAVPLDFTGAGFTAVASLDPQRLHDGAVDAVHAVLAEHAPQLVDHAQERVVESHSPGQALLHAAENASMLVVGAHHHHALGLLLGSTATGCTRHATCPVVVVPEGWHPVVPTHREEVLT